MFIGSKFVMCGVGAEVASRVVLIEQTLHLGVPALLVGQQPLVRLPLLAIR
jgi:hypothetical protein